MRFLIILLQVIKTFCATVFFSTIVSGMGHGAENEDNAVFLSMIKSIRITCDSLVVYSYPGKEIDFSKGGTKLKFDLNDCSRLLKNQPSEYYFDPLFNSVHDSKELTPEEFAKETTAQMEARLKK